MNSMDLRWAETDWTKLLNRCEQSRPLLVYQTSEAFYWEQIIVRLMIFTDLTIAT